MTAQKDIGAHIISQLAKQADSTRAEQMERYMRNQFPFYGVMAKERRQISRDVIKKHGLPSQMDWKRIITDLWSEPERECQYVALDLIKRCHNHWRESDLDFFKEIIISKSWWDTVDSLASNIIGLYFRKFESKMVPKAIEMNASENIWLIRTSIIFQLKYGADTNESLLFKCIIPHMDADEFFIQKAIGWSLRQYARINPASVISFVNMYPLKPLSKREALKNLRSRQV